jgi:hypothetical protein
MATKLLSEVDAFLSENKSDFNLENLLYSFKCSKDNDIEKFVHNKALRFEKTGKSRTYLILDNTKAMRLLAIFSLSIKSLTIPETLSNSQRKKLDGKYTRCDEHKAGFLIGQLAKNENFQNEISGIYIMEEVMKVIFNAKKIIGGTFVYAECKDIAKVIKYYTDNGFIEFSEENKMKQMLLHI